MRFRNAILERAVAVAGLLLAAPVLACAAAAILLEDGWPVIFAQVRIGRGGRPFRLYKLRSMRAAPGPAITAAGDRRISRVGRVLRAYKIDELPQLWNVLKGDMSLVGPRPEVPEYVDAAHPLWPPVLALRPGITDLATLLYRDEEELLAGADDPARCYRERILPAKLRLNSKYQTIRTGRTDCRLLVMSVWYSLRPRSFDRDRIARWFLPR